LVEGKPLDITNLKNIEKLFPRTIRPQKEEGNLFDPEEESESSN